MNRADANRVVPSSDGFSRRDVLHAGAASLLGLSMPTLLAGQAHAASRSSASDRSCIFLFLVGGPSQIDTFDPKPDAPSDVRGPFRPIRTNVPGIQISELFPRTARQADKFAIIRSMHHDAPATHEAGHQLMQTGRFFRDGPAFPHVGCVYGWLRGSPGELPAHVMLPHVIGNTGGNLPHGQDAGFLGREHDPFVVNADPSDPSFAASSLPLPAHVHAMRAASQGLPILSVEEAAAAETQLASPSIRAAFDLSREPNALREAYGRSPFGQSCLLARRLVERGVRFVTVNMFEKVLGELTWDVHGSAPFGTVESYRAGVGPMFDRAYSTLLADLASRGLLGRTLVVATGEFGRTPTINPSGGRDHWPHVWSMLMAGGGVKGGQVIGASDERGAYPKDRPTRPQEVIASIYHALGVDLNMRLPDPQGDPIPLVEPGAQPIRELF